MWHEKKMKAPVMCYLITCSSTFVKNYPGESSIYHLLDNLRGIPINLFKGSVCVLRRKRTNKQQPTAPNFVLVQCREVPEVDVLSKGVAYNDPNGAIWCSILTVLSIRQCVCVIAVGVWAAKFLPNCKTFHGFECKGEGVKTFLWMVKYMIYVDKPVSRYLSCRYTQFGEAKMLQQT